MSAMPRTVPLDINSIPAELTRWPHWVCWRWKQARKEWTKVPINPATGQLASHADPDTWGTFEDAVNAADTHHGIGYVFAADDPFAGVDLDDCVTADGVIADWAAQIIGAADTYAEISPSGSGVKLIVKAELPGPGRKEPEIEMYDRLRFFTITGKKLPDVPGRINHRGQFIEDAYQRYFPERKAKVTLIRPAPTSTMDERTVIDRASSAKNGGKFRALFDGNTAGYGSQSEADLALCSMIAFWTGPDHDRIDRVFRQSGLCRPKWDRDDYRESTLTIACDRAEFWEPGSDNDPTIIFDRVADDREEAQSLPEYPYIIQVADGLKEPRQPDRWLVEGILRDESIQLIVGPPKTYKSFFAQELSIAVGTGSPMFSEFPTIEPRRVLYVQEESARSHLWARYEGILRGRGMHPEVLRDQVWAITNQGIRLDQDDSLERLLREGVEAVQPHLVIFDPLREMHWQDENKAEAMLPILRTFKMLRDRYKISVAIIHHNNKNPLYTSPADSIRGTSAIWAAMDGAVFVSTTEEDKVMKVQFTLKEGGQTPPFLYSIKDDEDAIRFSVVHTDGAAPKARFDRMDIVRWARERGDWWPIEAAIEEFQIRDNTIRQQVRGLVASGHIKEKTQARNRKLYAHLEADDDEPTF